MVSLFEQLQRYGLLTVGAEVVKTLALHPLALYGALKYHRPFEKVKRFCMFIGYPRSGHSLIGSLLDAHPRAVIAHELNVLGRLLAGFSKEQLYYLLVRNAREFTESGRVWGAYRYKVPGGYHARYKDALNVLGDKDGASTTLMLHYMPHLLDRIIDLIDVPIRFIHIVRNPYDNISTIYRKNIPDLDESVDYYFTLCETVEWIKNEVGQDAIFEMRHEDFIADPVKYIRMLCDFMSLSAPSDYIANCASIVFDSPHQTRHEITWEDAHLKRIAEGIRRYPFLKGYCYMEKSQKIHLAQRHCARK